MKGRSGPGGAVGASAARKGRGAARAEHQPSRRARSISFRIVFQSPWGDLLTVTQAPPIKTLVTPAIANSLAASESSRAWSALKYERGASGIAEFRTHFTALGFGVSWNFVTVKGTVEL